MIDMARHINRYCDCEDYPACGHTDDFEDNNDADYLKHSEDERKDGWC